MKDELSKQIMRPNRYSYLTGDNNENKKSKRLKKSVIKWKLKLEDYKYCLEDENRINQLEKWLCCG